MAWENKCSSCQQEIEKNGKETKRYNFSLNNQEISLCEKCWEEKKNDYKVKLKAEFEKLEEWERENKRVNVGIFTHCASGGHIGHVDLGNLCKECDKWCDQENSGIEFCSPKCKLFIEEKRELKHLQEQWGIYKNFPSDYPGRQKIQDRLRELERKYNPNPQEKEREQIKQYFTKNNIKSIKLENDQLVIEYNNSQTETKAVNTSELQVIKSYCQQHNNSISYQQLIDLENNKNKSTNWTPWILGGTGIVVVIIGLVWLVKRNKRKTRNKK